MSSALLAEIGRRLGEPEAVTPPAPADAEDVWGRGAAPIAVLRPRQREGLPELVRFCAAEGIGIVPRGGGLSYTAGYLCAGGRFLLLDLRALDRVVAIAPGYVRVEAGASWAALDRALAARGLRSACRGPLSGRESTVGGALSQHAAFLGAAAHGAVADGVLSLTILDGRGRVFATGAAAAGCPPFLRLFGPDLGGCFLGDAGSLGIKLEASLRLLPRPAEEAFLSFAYPTAEAFLEAFAALAERALASELFGFDPAMGAIRLARARLAEDLALAGAVRRRHGLVALLGVLIAGRRLLAPGEHSLHAAFEGEAPGVARAKCRAARRLLARLGGREIAPSIPRVLKSAPFPPLNVLLGPGGERWVPVHGVLPLDRLAPAERALRTRLAASEGERAALGVRVAFLYLALGSHAAVLEPCLYWPDARGALHRERVEPAMLARLPEHPPNPEGRALVARLRRELASLLRAEGAAHFQLGRYYPWRGELDPASRALFEALKRELDPAGILNPGALPEEPSC
ncbi:MAG: FAD-binding oxidoreductase [Xanthomonadales bacterium]|nr:FAD-binding oxidoreductase [Xanthomonadales bacterium]